MEISLGENNSDQFLRSDTELEIRENEVVKRMGVEEKLAYDLLFEHHQTLADSKPSVIIPEVKQNEQGKYIISRLSGMKMLDVSGHFGLFIPSEDVLTYLEGFEVIGKTRIDKSKLVDYDSPKLDQTQYLLKYVESNTTPLNPYSERILKAARVSTKVASRLVPVIVHGDENPSNFQKVEKDLMVVDWVNLAVARRPYPFAKFAHHLPLNAEAREAIIKESKLRFNDDEQTYFWGILATKSFITLGRALSGFYDSGFRKLKDPERTKDLVLKSLKDVVERGLSELDI